MDEDDNGARLADAVAVIISERYPNVAVLRLDSAPIYNGTMVTITPSEPRAARLWLYANYDWSFDLHCGRFVLYEQVPMDESEGDRIKRVVAAIEEVAADGVSRTWLDRIIGTGDKVGPVVAKLAS